MTKADLLTCEIAKELLDYDPTSGRLFWKERAASFFSSEGSCRSWNNRYSGKEALTGIDDKGYRTGCILNKNYKSHRVIWLIEKGRWPSGDIDHIDGDTLNNKIENLRDVPHAINRRNSAINKNNTTGVAGVIWHERLQRWMAQMRVGRRTVYLGVYATLHEATIARKAAEKVTGYHPNHGRSA